MSNFYTFILFCVLLNLPFVFTSYANSTECNYLSGHGFVLFTGSDCKTFWISHLGEFECPHQYDVKVMVTIDDDSKNTYCNALSTGNEITYTIIPEFYLTDLISGNILQFESDIMTGFFGNSITTNSLFQVKKILYTREYGLVESTVLQYLIFPASNPGMFFLTKYISTPPDFDQILYAQVDSFVWPAGRTWPMVIDFNKENTYVNRLGNGSSTQVGTIRYPDTNGLLADLKVQITIKKNIYPGPNQYNGDGQDDYKQYCIEPSRPTWQLCSPSS